MTADRVSSHTAVRSVTGGGICRVFPFGGTPSSGAAVVCVTVSVVVPADDVVVVVIVVVGIVALRVSVHGRLLHAAMMRGRA